MSEVDGQNPPRARNWLAAAVPALLVGVFVIGLSGQRDQPAPGCLPGIPTTPRPLTPGTPGQVVWPIEAPVSSTFGDREGGFHHGADFAAPVGTTIVSATTGTVVAAGPASGFGNWIIVDTPTTTASGPGVVSAVYGHMHDDGLLVRIGDTVTAGQPIARVGNAGQSTGPHLHFEIVPGGRLSGGRAIDPLTWLDEHAGPRSTTAPVLVANPRPVADPLPALPSDKGSEEHLQTDAVRLVRALAARFPQIERFENWRPHDDIGEHPAGRAVDAMIPDFDTPAGRDLGDQVVAYVHANATELRLTYTIWRREYTPTTGAPMTMPEQGSPTADHYDHVHITVEGGATPALGHTYTAPTTETGPGRGSGCGTDPVAVAAAAGIPAPGLTPGTVPEAFAPWIAKAATTCDAVTAPLIAAQLENESGFRVDAHNAISGADGPAQFLPSTWAAKAVDGDGDGSRDPRSIPDAVMSQAAYDCELAAIMTTALSEGRVHGELTELWLSAYNCGPGATLGQGGVCQNPETLAYVHNIPARAHSFAAPATERRR